jgi:heme-degrading monooxygenase HmoA
MAIARLVEVKGSGQAEYDRIVGLTSMLTNPPQGVLVHVAGLSSNGWRVFDLWDSEDAVRDYEKTRLNPAIKQSGLDMKPRAEIQSIHSVQVGDRNLLTQLGTAPVSAQLVDTAGMNATQYDRVTALVGAASSPPKGLILHAAGPSSNGWRVFNLWTSEQAFQDFQRDHLETAFKQAGITMRPHVDFYPVYKGQVMNMAALTKLGERTMRA